MSRTPSVSCESFCGDLGPLAAYVKPTVTTLGVMVDSNFMLETHIDFVVKPSFYHLRLLAKVKSFLTRQLLEIVSHAFV